MQTSVRAGLLLAVAGGISACGGGDGGARGAASSRLAQCDTVAAICVRSAPDAYADCLARLDLDGKTLPYYTSHPLDTENDAIESLVVIQHGNNRNAWDYYDVIAGAAVARDPAHTAVLAPLFQTFNNTCGKDPIGPDDLYWGCSDWKEGYAAKNGATDSFTALDTLIATAKGAFPNLARVTVAGYSAGGQTIQRYAAGNREEDRTPDIATRYVVGSPGSYMYLDGQRLRSDATCSDAASCDLDAGSFEVPAYAPGCETSDPGVVTGSGDPGYDDYRYGLENRKGYLASVSDADLVARYPARNVVYVLSEGDSNAGPGTAYSVLDKSCPGMVEGPLGASFRLQRGLVYHRYITLLFGASHGLLVIPTCTHDETCVLSSSPVQDAIFGP